MALLIQLKTNKKSLSILGEIKSDMYWPRWNRIFERHKERSWYEIWRPIGSTKYTVHCSVDHNLFLVDLAFWSNDPVQTSGEKPEIFC